MPEGLQSMAPGSRCFQSTDLEALDECRLDAECFPEGRVRGCTCV